MLKGLQTHFTGTILGFEKCQQLFEIGVQLGRIDGMESSASVIWDQVSELDESNIRPYVTISQPSIIAELPHCIYGIEYLNEPDGRIEPAEYMRGLKDCQIECEKAGFDCFGPVVSNLIRSKPTAQGAELRGIDYLRICSPYPDRMKGAIHRYGGDDGKVVKPHIGFVSRDHEVLSMHTALGLTRPFGVSEFGWASIGKLTEDKAAANIAWEWKFWNEQKALFAVLYQLNDGPGTGTIDNYGLFRFDGTLKEAVARTFR